MVHPWCTCRRRAVDDIEHPAAPAVRGRRAAGDVAVLRKRRDVVRSPYQLAGPGRRRRGGAQPRPAGMYMFGGWLQFSRPSRVHVDRRTPRHHTTTTTTHTPRSSQLLVCWSHTSASSVSSVSSACSACSVRVGSADESRRDHRLRRRQGHRARQERRRRVVELRERLRRRPVPVEPPARHLSLPHASSRAGHEWEVRSHGRMNGWTVDG